MDCRTQTRSEITACTKERDAGCWWPRDHPNVGVDGESTENVRVSSILAFSPDGHRLLPSEKFSKKSICPVMYDESSGAGKTQLGAISSG
jgi:hypothetical protein